MKTKVDIIPPAIVFFDCWNHQAFENLSVIDCFLVGCLNPMKLQPTMKQIRTWEWKGPFESSVDHSPLSLSGVNEPAQGHQSDFWYWDVFRIWWDIYLRGEEKEDINISGLPLDCFSLIFSWLSKFFLGDYIERDSGVDLLWPQQVEVSCGFSWSFLRLQQSCKQKVIYKCRIFIAYMLHDCKNVGMGYYWYEWLYDFIGILTNAIVSCALCL